MCKTEIKEMYMDEPVQRRFPRNVVSAVAAGTLVLSMCPAAAFAQISELNPVQAASASESTSPQSAENAAQDASGKAGDVVLTTSVGSDMTLKVVLNADLETYTAYIEGTGGG